MAALNATGSNVETSASGKDTLIEIVSSVGAGVAPGSAVGVGGSVTCTSAGANVGGAVGGGV